MFQIFGTLCCDSSTWPQIWLCLFTVPNSFYSSYLERYHALAVLFFLFLPWERSCSGCSVLPVLTLREIMLWLFLRTVISPWISTLVMLPVRKTSFLKSLQFTVRLSFSKNRALHSSFIYCQFVFCGRSTKYLHMYCRVHSCAGVFQNIDPPTSLSLYRVCPPPKWGGVHTRRAVRGVGDNILEDARHRIGLLQYIIISLREEVTVQESFMFTTIWR